MCVHSVDGGEVGLHSPLLAELQLFVCVICAAHFSAAQRDYTNRPYLPTCKAKACFPCLVSCKKEEREWRTAERKTSLSILSNPILALRPHEHEQAISFLTCEERTRVNWGTGKATQRVNA